MAPILRDLWLRRVQHAWEHRPIVWLSGVRRVGKTTLSQMLAGADYFNCDLPSVRRMLRDPELFLDAQSSGSTLIFDEVHRLSDPSQLLKIIADEYPGLRVLATGSSTMAATRKFRDSLSGRKHSICLHPVLWEECNGWLGSADLDRRLLHGGLPEALLSESPPPDFYSEWVDSFYARDIEDLFGFRNRVGFQALFRLMLRQSGGQLQINRLASDCGLSRPTVRSPSRCHGDNARTCTYCARFPEGESERSWRDLSVTGSTRDSSASREVGRLSVPMIGVFSGSIWYSTAYERSLTTRDFSIGATSHSANWTL